MITIEIDEEQGTHTDMAYLLRHIADLIDKGSTKGFSPNWELKGEEEPDADEQTFR